LEDALRNLLDEGRLSRREAVKMIARDYGLPVSEVYQLSLRLSENDVEE
jgi:hypothetical protein